LSLQLPSITLIQRDSWLASAAEGKRVLHIGCTDYPLTQSRIESKTLLHSLIASRARKLTGCDKDDAGLEVMRSLMPKHVFFSIDVEKENAFCSFDKNEFDLVMAPDVIEHLENFGAFLKNLHYFSATVSFMITVPSAFSLKRLGYLALTGREHVHPDHVAYFSVSTLTRLIEGSGFKIEKFFSFFWKNQTRRNFYSNFLLRLISGPRASILADELAVKFKRAC
jgi:predicted TPR repeat methyltransferase